MKLSENKVHLGQGIDILEQSFLSKEHCDNNKKLIN